MRGRPFHIVTDWRIKGNLSDVARLLLRMEDWPMWWGGTYRAVKLRDDGSYLVRSKGLLPLSLRWTARILPQSLPYAWVLEMAGDLNGHSCWSLRQAGVLVEVENDWYPFGPPLLGSLTAPSHRRAMAQGQQALHAELARQGRMGDPPMLPDPPAQPARLSAIQ